jgi:hypothetical protein
MRKYSRNSIPKNSFPTISREFFLEHSFSSILSRAFFLEHSFSSILSRKSFFENPFSRILSRAMQSMDCTVQTTAAPDVSIDFAVQQLPGSQLPGLQISHALGLPRAWLATCLACQVPDSPARQFRGLSRSKFRVPTRLHPRYPLSDAGLLEMLGKLRLQATSMQPYRPIDGGLSARKSRGPRVV